jgi:hypothetical protein
MQQDGQQEAMACYGVGKEQKNEVTIYEINP